MNTNPFAEFLAQQQQQQQSTPPDQSTDTSPAMPVGADVEALPWCDEDLSITDEQWDEIIKENGWEHVGCALTIPQPRPQRIQLGQPVKVPNFTGFSPTIGATIHMGFNAVKAVQDVVQRPARAVAMDIETAGVGPDSFHIKCVTAAWEDVDGTHSVLLDPRDEEHVEPIKSLVSWATLLVFHNAAFDVPVLVAHRLMFLPQIAKVWDTIVAARMAFPDKLISKNLESLAARDDVLGMEPNEFTIKQAFSTAGFSTSAEGFRLGDIAMPVYRLGAMADTIVTLRLAPVLMEAVQRWLTSNPLNHPMIPDRARSLELLEREQITNRVMLKVNARGLLVDQQYLEQFMSAHETEINAARDELKAQGLDPDKGTLGSDLVKLLESRGELPSNWPTTATGKLSANKSAMKKLDDHPLALAHRRVAEMKKINSYLDMIAEFGQITGRVHPQVAILGASATGRMAASEPPLQQFSDKARGIIIPDVGTAWCSLDWSSIEPVVVANCAGDREFLQGFNEQGADLYEPITRVAGVTRKVAKVVLLAAMYGQGKTKLANTLGTSVDEAQNIQQRVFQAMPETRKFLDSLRATGERQGVTMTADGRLLPIPRDPATGKAFGYKATNYFTQGTAASVLSETVNAVHRAGLEDAIKLAMHDELVVDYQAAHDIRKIMETPPAWLEDFAGHKVVFRTDSNLLRQGRWAYV